MREQKAPKWTRDVLFAEEYKVRLQLTALRFLHFPTRSRVFHLGAFKRSTEDLFIFT